MKKSKLAIKPEHIENFSIDVVKDYEGCVDALKYLKKIYGDTVKPLRACSKDFRVLIKDHNKSEWVINFFLNMLKPQYRVEFYSKEFHQALEKVSDPELKINLQLAFDSFSKKVGKKALTLIEQSLDRHLSNIDSELLHQVEIEIQNKLHYERAVLESVRFYISDKDRKFTRHVTDGLIKIAESKAHLPLVQYDYESSIKEIALSLMEFTELWDE